MTQDEEREWQKELEEIDRQISRLFPSEKINKRIEREKEIIEQEEQSRQRLVILQAEEQKRKLEQEKIAKEEREKKRKAEELKKRIEREKERIEQEERDRQTLVLLQAEEQRKILHEPRAWGNADSNLSISIDRSVYNEIRKSIGSMPAETIGLIFGDPSRFHITKFCPYYHDRYERRAAYSDIETVKKLISSNTNNKIRFLGKIHSHPIDEKYLNHETKIAPFPYLGTLSEADVGSSKWFMSYCKSYSPIHYKDMPFSLEGIVFSAPDNDNIFRLFIHRVFENKPHELFLSYQIMG